MKIDSSETIMVSICCLTFNHEAYLRQCLDGFFMQQANFRFEVLIHDDASTDATVAIVKEYMEKFPGVINPLFQTVNQYSLGQRGMSMRYNFPRAKGKYIALCEGDDYWTDPLKLQKQVDLLEANPQYALCFHDAKTVFENAEKTPVLFSERYRNLYVKQVFTHEDIIRNDWFISTPTMLFRKGAFKFEDWMFRVYSGDYALHLAITKHGNAMYLPDVMAVVRKHAAGMSQVQSKQYYIRRSIEQQGIFAGFVDKKYRKIIYKRIMSQCFHVMKSRSTQLNLGLRLKCGVDFMSYSLKYFFE